MAATSVLEPRSDDGSNLAYLLLSEMSLGQYLAVALLTVLVYDAIITMDKEVKYFWNGPKRTIGIIYFANRYIGMFGAISDVAMGTFQETIRKCVLGYWGTGISYLITVTLIDYILLLRVLALYSQNKRLGICLKLLVMLEAVFGLGVLIFSAFRVQIYATVLAPGLTVCTEVDSTPLLLPTMSWVLPLVYAIISMTLALYKATEFWRISGGFTGLDLVKVIVQDQALYFSFVLTFYILQIVEDQISVANQFLSFLLTCLGSPTLLCVLGSRLLFHLKEAAELGVNGGTSYRSETISVMVFS